MVPELGRLSRRPQPRGRRAGLHPDPKPDGDEAEDEGSRGAAAWRSRRTPRSVPTRRPLRPLPGGLEAMGARHPLSMPGRARVSGPLLGSSPILASPGKRRPDLHGERLSTGFPSASVCFSRQPTAMKSSSVPRDAVLHDPAHLPTLLPSATLLTSVTCSPPPHHFGIRGRPVPRPVKERRGNLCVYWWIVQEEPLQGPRDDMD